MNLIRLSSQKRILNKFEIPNGLSEIDRSLLLLKKTHKTQRMSVLVNLPTILRDFPEGEELLLPKNI
jgi:hypothetical protein